MRYLSFFPLSLLLLTTACVHDNFVFQSSKTQVIPSAMAVPEFDEDKWIDIPEDESCVVYLYRGKINESGQVNQVELLGWEASELFEPATEDAMKSWVLNVGPSKEFHSVILYGKKGTSEVVFVTSEEAKVILESQERNRKKWMMEKSSNPELQARKPLFRREPFYPSELVRAGKTGEALLRFELDDDGSTKNIEVIAADPMEFAAPSISAVKRWRYEEGHSTGVKTVRFRFSIKGQHDCSSYVRRNLGQLED